MSTIKSRKKTQIVMVIYKKGGLLALLLFMLSCYGLVAQAPNYSMYQYAPMFTNPGQTGMVEDVRLTLNYRNQPIEIDDSFRASSLSGFYPVNVGSHRLVFAGSVLNDRASSFITANGGALGVAYSVRVTRRSELSLGLQGGYFQRKTNDDFITDDQFVNGGFDPSVVSKDALLNQRKSYPVLNGGLYYRLLGLNGQEKAFLGVAAFNANEPDIAFLDVQEDRLPVSFRATAGYQVYEGATFSVMPNMRWATEAGNHFFNLGSWFNYALEGAGNEAKKLALGLWYNTNELGVVSVAYEQPNFTVGTSYDLPIGNELRTAQNGIFELAVSLRLKKKPRRAMKATAPSAARPAPVANVEEKAPEDEVGTASPPVEDEPEANVEAPAAETAPQTTQPQEIITEPEVVVLGMETMVPLAPKEADENSLTEEEKAVLSKTVNFELNSNQLDEPSQTFLNKVAGILNGKPNLRVRLTGHSCDKGPEQFNETLSLQRAQAVQQYLEEKGLNPDRVEVIGMGERQPLHPNSTREGRIQNRRVVFEVIR